MHPLTYESFEEEHEVADVEDEKVEDVLPVLFEEGDGVVVFLAPIVLPLLVVVIDLETGHPTKNILGETKKIRRNANIIVCEHFKMIDVPCYVGGSVQKILFGSCN